MINPPTVYQSEAEEKILDLIHVSSEMTDSDIQGAVLAIVMTYVPEVRPN